MTTTQHPLNTFSIGSTLVDALHEFVHGRTKASALLVGAAALSTKVPGLGTATSLLLRLFRRLR